MDYCLAEGREAFWAVAFFTVNNPEEIFGVETSD